MYCETTVLVFGNDQFLVPTLCAFTTEICFLAKSLAIFKAKKPNENFRLSLKSHSL